MRIRVLVADDQSLIRSGLRMIVDDQPDMQVVGEASDGLHAVGLARRTVPHVVLMDVRMPNLDGIGATRQIYGLSGSPRVIILTTYDLDEYVYEGLAAGASGFLLKDATPSEIVNAIRVVAAGDAQLAPSATRRLIEQFATATPGPDSKRRLALLTPREFEILRLVAGGLSSAEMAEALLLAPSTIKSHVRHLLEKVPARDRVQLTIFAYESGVVRPGELDVDGLPTRRPPK